MLNHLWLHRLDPASQSDPIRKNYVLAKTVSDPVGFRSVVPTSPQSFYDYRGYWTEKYDPAESTRDAKVILRKCRGKYSIGIFAEFKKFLRKYRGKTHSS